ncbi:ABC transporter permease subunit [Paeniglutamicibacter antarcticus]|uniref:ABC transporter permease subunit n=1 Tax=Arthrobacter terrae TaxID=2935737 RepID=A0A931CP52_9MICC|nr:ABC transporter permease subunit [Arthrobacter terrae]MBG0741783.1 ABC transporter permease subunit [Arthrobacter terrae]
MKTPLLTIAGKEIRDAFREKTFLILGSALAVLVVVSVLTASFKFHDEVALYQQAVDQLKAAGQPTDILTIPQYSPLQMLRASIEYIEIIGAVLAIVLGYLSVARERRSRALPLVLTRPISRARFVSGKILGGAILLSALVAVFAVFAGAAVTLIGSVPLSGAEIVKLCVAAVAALVYLMIFFLISLTLAGIVRNLPTALILALVLWVLFVLVLPQIGDTMDVDNQVPGGLFNSLHLSKDAEHAVTGQLQFYEWIRNATEVASPTKHLERFDFAVLGIKDIYNGRPLAAILAERWDNITVLAAVFTAAIATTYYTLIKKTPIWRN